MKMQRYRDVTMFVCGLIAGLALMALFARDPGKGKGPTGAVESLESNRRAKVSFIDSVDERKATAVMRCIHHIPSDGQAYLQWLGETERQRLIRCFVGN